MTTRRTCFSDPPVAIEYDAVIDGDGETVNTLVPVRFYDLATSPDASADSATLVFTAIENDARYRDAIYDPERVRLECEAVWARDALYVAALQAALPHVAPERITRFDQDGAVLLTADADAGLVVQTAKTIGTDPKVAGNIYLNGIFVGGGLGAATGQ